MSSSILEFCKSHPELIRETKSTRYLGLSVLKYTRKAFFSKQPWSEEMRELRGVVVGQSGDPVVMPFRKIFYPKEHNNQDFEANAKLLAVRKVNGFMAALTYNKVLDTVLVSTTGSLDSSYVDIIQEWVTPRITQVVRSMGKRLNKNYTHLFECVDPDRDQPHPILNETPGLYYLGARVVEWNGPEITDQVRLDAVATEMGVLRPEWFYSPYAKILEHLESVQHEGFVLHDEKGLSLKVKSPFYRAVKYLGRTPWQRLDSTKVPAKYLHVAKELEDQGHKFWLLSERERFAYVSEQINKKEK